MKKYFFLVAIIVIVLIGRFLQQNNVSGYGFIIIGLVYIVVSVRRINLNLKPWWYGSLKDIPKYFKES